MVAQVALIQTQIQIQKEIQKYKSTNTNTAAQVALIQIQIQKQIHCINTEIQVCKYKFGRTGGTDPDEGEGNLGDRCKDRGRAEPWQQNAEAGQ